MPITIEFNTNVTDYLNRLPLPLKQEVTETIDYFTEHGRAAQLPDVARIVTAIDTYETRNQWTDDTGRRYTIRVLYRFHSPAVAIATVAGDKDRWDHHNNGDWYDTFVPLSNRVYDLLKGTQ